mgnify:FL=1
MIQDDELFKDKIRQKRNNLKNLVLFYSGLKNIVRKMNIQLDWMTNMGGKWYNKMNEKLAN